VIYHLIERSEWEHAQLHDGGNIRIPSGDFLHCCDEQQLEGVRAAYFAVDADVVALALDPTRLMSETRYEPGSGGQSERFPHVFGPVLAAEILRVDPVVLRHT